MLACIIYITWNSQALIKLLYTKATINHKSWKLQWLTVFFSRLCVLATYNFIIIKVIHFITKITLFLATTVRIIFEREVIYTYKLCWKLDLVLGCLLKKRTTSDTDFLHFLRISFDFVSSVIHDYFGERIPWSKFLMRYLMKFILYLFMFFSSCNSI